MNRYEENMYNYLKRKGFGEKYDHAGIYCIKINDRIVYIGKSHNMLKRVAQHYVAIKKQSERKYRILAEAQRKGYTIGFDVLYDAKRKRYDDITEEIGQKEGEYIREYMPCLNTQIPKEENWNFFDINQKAKTITFSETIKEGN